MEAEADLASPLHFHPRGGGAHLLSETDRSGKLHIFNVSTVMVEDNN